LALALVLATKSLMTTLHLRQTRGFDLTQLSSQLKVHNGHRRFNASVCTSESSKINTENRCITDLSSIISDLYKTSEVVT